MGADVEYYAQVRERGIVTYARFSKGGNKTATYTKRTGMVNEQQVRRFKKYFDLMLMGSDVKEHVTKDGVKFWFRLNFLTLTFPGNIYPDDNPAKAFYEIKRMLSREGLKHFVWRKELQAKTTNREHLHIVANKFIHYATLQRLWTRSLELHCPGSLNEYRNKFGKEFPPSTEVKAIKSVRKCRMYVAKYLSKKGSSVTGNNFGVSRELSRLNYFTDVVDSGIERALNLGSVKEINDFTKWHGLPIETTQRVMSETWKANFSEWLKELKSKING